MAARLHATADKADGAAVRARQIGGGNRGHGGGARGGDPVAVQDRQRLPGRELGQDDERGHIRQPPGCIAGDDAGPFRHRPPLLEGGADERLKEMAGSDGHRHLRLVDRQLPVLGLEDPDDRIPQQPRRGRHALDVGDGQVADRHRLGRTGQAGLSAGMPGRRGQDQDLIAADLRKASFSFSTVKSLLRAASMTTASRRLIRSKAPATLSATSCGMTTAPCLSAWTRSPERTTIPCTFTSQSKCTRWTKAWEGAMTPARNWKPGAIMSRSRTLPLVTAPSQPSALCTLEFTSPQKEP